MVDLTRMNTSELEELAQRPQTKDELVDVKLTKEEYNVVKY